MKLIRAHCSGLAHELAVKTVMAYGYPITTEEGEKTMECEEICVRIDTPLEEPRISEKSGFGEMACKEYANQLIYGGKNKFDYDYHERLFTRRPGAGIIAEACPCNQVQYMIDKLSAEATSRRAIAITWIPEIDYFAPSVPCLQLVQCVVRHGKLDMKVVFRSNDMLSALGPNMYGLTELQRHIATRLGIEIGTYTHISLVPHVYHIRDASQLEDMLGSSVMYGAAGEVAVGGARI